MTAPSQREEFKELLDAVLADLAADYDDFPASIAAERVAAQLGMAVRARDGHVEVALDGRSFRGGPMRQTAHIGHVGDDYTPGGHLSSHSIVWR